MLVWIDFAPQARANWTRVASQPFVIQTFCKWPHPHHDATHMVSSYLSSTFTVLSFLFLLHDAATLRLHHLHHCSNTTLAYPACCLDVFVLPWHPSAKVASIIQARFKCVPLFQILNMLQVSGKYANKGPCCSFHVLENPIHEISGNG